jgi:hypothetical protein
VQRSFISRSVLTVVMTVLACVGLLFVGDAAGATSGAVAADAVPASAAPCTAWNVSSDLVYVYSDANAGSAAWGYLWPGGGTGSSAQCAYAGSSTFWGAHHNLCGGGSLYVAVYYWVNSGYVIGFVPDACVWVAY